MAFIRVLRDYWELLWGRRRSVAQLEAVYWGYRNEVRQWLAQLRNLAVEMSPECDVTIKQRFDLQRLYMDRTDERFKYLIRVHPGRLNTGTTSTAFVDSIDKCWREEDDALLLKQMPEYASLASTIAEMRADAIKSDPHITAALDRVRRSERFAELTKNIGRKFTLLDELTWSTLGRSHGGKS